MAQAIDRLASKDNWVIGKVMRVEQVHNKIKIEGWRSGRGKRMDYGSREDNKITSGKVDAEAEFATGFTVCVKPDSQF